MEDNKDTAHHFEEPESEAGNRAEIVTGRLAVGAVRPRWPGVLLWLALAVAYVGLALTGSVEDLWFAAPLIVTLVIAQILETAVWIRRVIGLVAIFLALSAIAVASRFLIWKDALPLREEIHAETIVLCVFIGSSLALPCLLRGFRIHLFPAAGLNPNSSLHTTAAVMFLFTLMMVRWLFVMLSEEPGETILLDLKDPIISLLTDIPLALAGVGFLMRRDLKQSLVRLGFVPITLREFVQAVAVTVPLVLGVVLFEFAEEVFFPEIHALEDRFPLEFANVSPLLGIPALSLAAGVGEEAVFRGALQPRFGILLTSLLFAALHVQYQLPGMILIFGIGVILGIMRNRKSTTFTACVHMVYDIIAFSLPDF
ncbi:MAG: CPBP family intramembrane glutamic endopeptidase [Candidatus Binatia bacterium]